MKIAYLGTIIDHGYTLAQWSSGLLLLMDAISSIERIDVYCPSKNSINTVDISYSDKIEVKPEIYVSSPFSMIRALKYISKQDYDLFIININPTVFGNGSIINFLAHIIPFLVKNIFKMRIIVIYHNSVLTNDVSNLGYNSMWDRIRELILFRIEYLLFKNIDTYLLVDIYVDLINKLIPKNSIKLLDIPAMEVIPTLHLNSIDFNENKHYLKTTKKDAPSVLLHGYWGPQKNLLSALEALEKCRKGGFNFEIIISGVPNPHFPEYAKEHNIFLTKYANLITGVRGHISEKEIFQLFTNADLVLLPYSVAGGHSGVLAIAYALDTPTIARRLPEFESISKEFHNLTLYDDDLFDKLCNFFLKWNPKNERIIYPKKIFYNSLKNLEKIIGGENY